MKQIIAVCAIVGVAVLAGCGGGGGNGSSGTSTGGTSRATVLLTDSFREDFGHVWATIYHVELIPQGGGSPVVVYDNTSGVQIDLKTLRDVSGNRYSFLGNASVPAGTYTGVNITIGATMQIYKNGTAVGDPIAVSSTIPVDSTGHPVLSLTFKTAKTLGSGTTNLIIDFDLARFVLRNSQVLPAIQEGDGTGVTDPKKHEKGDYHGTVSNLTGTSPTLTFTLTSASGSTTTVVTTASTAIYGEGTLQNGSKIAVSGTLDTTTQNLVATEIEVAPDAVTAATPRICGAATALDATAGTFTIAATRVSGFTPSQTTVKVVTNSSTVFYTDPGTTATQTAFFTALAATPSAAVKGTYDSATNTLTATTAKVIDTSKEGGWEKDQHQFRGDHAGWGNGHVRPHGED